jgi:RHS repeat-associated protein
MSNLNYITITQKDQKAGTNHFKLRDYDARLARWTTIDPYNQYHSPYLAMGNNPISKIDPDGGMATGGGYKINETFDYFINKQNRMNKEMRGFGMYEDGSGLHGGGGGVSGASGYNIDGLNVSASIGNRMLKNNSFLETVGSYNGLMLRGNENLSHTNGKLFINSYSFITVIEPNNFGDQLIGYQFSIGSVNFYKEVVTTSFEVGSVGGGGGGVPNWVETTIGVADATAGYFGTAYTVQAGQTLRYGQRVNGVVRSANTLTRANRISSLSTARTFSRAGTVLTFLSVGVTVVDGLTNDKGWQNHHTADLMLTGAIYGTAAAFPVVGWVAGGLYFAADLTTQCYTGKSITQNLLD